MLETSRNRWDPVPPRHGQGLGKITGTGRRQSSPVLLADSRVSVAEKLRNRPDSNSNLKTPNYRLKPKEKPMATETPASRVTAQKKRPYYVSLAADSRSSRAMAASNRNRRSAQPDAAEGRRKSRPSSELTKIKNGSARAARPTETRRHVSLSARRAFGKWSHGKQPTKGKPGGKKR